MDAGTLRVISPVSVRLLAGKAVEAKLADKGAITRKDAKYVVAKGDIPPYWIPNWAIEWVKKVK